MNAIPSLLLQVNISRQISSHSTIFAPIPFERISSLTARSSMVAYFMSGAEDMGSDLNIEIKIRYDKGHGAMNSIFKSDPKNISFGKTFICFETV